MKDTIVAANLTMSQHQAGVGVSRVHAYPCAMNRASWAITPSLGFTTDAKPQPRRFSRIS